MDNQVLPYDISQLLTDIQPGKIYSVRKFAVEELAKLGKSYPVVVSALMAVAENDVSEDVRKLASAALFTPAHQEILLIHPNIKGKYPVVETLKSTNKTPKSDTQNVIKINNENKSMNGNIACSVRGCINPVIGQCGGYQRSCGRFYCADHSIGSLCLDCARIKANNERQEKSSRGANDVNKVLYEVKLWPFGNLRVYSNRFEYETGLDKLVGGKKVLLTRAISKIESRGGDIIITSSGEKHELTIKPGYRNVLEELLKFL